MLRLWARWSKSWLDCCERKINIFSPQRRHLWERLKVDGLNWGQRFEEDRQKQKYLHLGLFMWPLTVSGPHLSFFNFCSKSHQLLWIATIQHDQFVQLRATLATNQCIIIWRSILMSLDFSVFICVWLFLLHMLGVGRVFIKFAALVEGWGMNYLFIWSTIRIYYMSHL